MFEQVIKNQFGYYELKEKPTPEALQQYYAEKYYQNAEGSYEKSYTPAEIAYFYHKIDQKFRILQDFVTPPGSSPRLLDVGCGEGWALQFFLERGWEVLGLDYSEYGCRSNHPDCLSRLRVGDIYENLKSLIDAKEQYHCIWLDNVLEHVLDPGALLRDCRELIQDGGVLVIEVPNDFSTVQQHLFTHNHISRPFWVAVPDHISYFNREGLEKLCAAVGWTGVRFLGDFPIDFNLFNPHTNYVENKSVGKSCHQTRVELENLFHEISPEKTNELYRVLGEMGLGRQIVGFFK